MSDTLLTEDLEVLIDGVLNGMKDVVKLPLLPISVYIDYIKKYTDDEGEWETNGYSCDFWMTFVTEGDTYVLSGDLWYCKRVTFEKKNAYE